MIVSNDARFLIRLRTRLAARRRGATREEVQEIVDAIDDKQEFSRMVSMYQAGGEKLPEFLAARAAEDVSVKGGPLLDFLKRIADWLTSEDGQKFIKFILALFGIVI